MTWTKLDDSMPDRPTIVALTDAAFRMHVSGLIYSNRMLTEGIVPASKVRTLIPRFRPAYLEELLAGHVWARQGDDFRIVDSAEDQLTKADVLALREKRAAAGRKGGLVSGKKRRREAERQARWGANASPSALADARSNGEANANPGPVPGLRVRNQSFVSSLGKRGPNSRTSEPDDDMEERGAADLVREAVSPLTVSDEQATRINDLAGELGEERVVQIASGAILGPASLDHWLDVLETERTAST